MYFPFIYTGDGSSKARDQYTIQEKAQHILASDNIGVKAYLNKLKAMKATGEFQGSIPLPLKNWKLPRLRAKILMAAKCGESFSGSIMNEEVDIRHQLGAVKPKAGFLWQQILSKHMCL